MSRVPLIDPDDPDLDAQTQAALAAAGSARPDAPVRNVYRAMANHPALLEKFLELTGDALPPVPGVGTRSGPA